MDVLRHAKAGSFQFRISQWRTVFSYTKTRMLHRATWSCAPHNETRMFLSADKAFVLLNLRPDISALTFSGKSVFFCNIHVIIAILSDCKHLSYSILARCVNCNRHTHWFKFPKSIFLFWWLLFCPFRTTLQVLPLNHSHSQYRASKYWLVLA